MGKTCIVCKTNPAVVSARIEDKNTGQLSTPVQLCEECYARISKIRKVETVPDPDMALAPKTNSASGKGIPHYVSIIRKLQGLFEAFIVLNIIAAIAGGIMIFFGTQEYNTLILISGIVLVASSVAGAISSYVLSLVCEAADDYFETHK